MNELDFLEKAAQCRRLAAGLSNANEAIRRALLALAQEFEDKAIKIGSKVGT